MVNIVMLKPNKASAATALVGFLSLFVAPAPSFATIYSYSVNASIEGGGSLKGTFSYNSSALPFTSNISALDLKVTGDPYADTTYDTSSIPFASLDIENDLNGGGEVTGDLKTDEYGTPQIEVTFPYPTGGAIITRTSSSFGDSFYSVDGATEFISGTVTAAAAPEPASWALMLVGFMAVGLGARSRRRLTVR